eukprot:m51a1_g14315 putative serine threonine protein (833) ;mRNA; r:5102-9953
MKLFLLTLSLVAAAAALATTSPYNWSSTPCTLLLPDTAHPPPGTLVVGVLHTLKSAANLEACIVMSVCQALSDASATQEFGSYNVSILLFDDLDLNSLGPAAAATFSRIPVVAVIGGDNSRVSISVLEGNTTHPGLSASGIPLISSQATSPALSDRAKYPRFLRVITSTALSSLAMVQMFSKYGITRIAGIGNNDSYGKGGLQKLVTYAAQAFVAYCASMTCLPLLEQARIMEMLQRPNAWILGNGLTSYPTLASIAVSAPMLAQVISNNTVIMGMSTAVDTNNVTDRFVAKMTAFMKTDELLSPFYTYFEYDAALALINAVKRMLAAGQDPHNRSLLYSTLVSLEYMGATGEITFDENGDRFATIAIFRYVSGNDDLASVGNWTIGSGIVIDPRHAPAQWRGSDVAAKVIPINKNAGIDKGKLLQEVSALRSLRHPNLLLFMCYARTADALIVVSEFMPRGSLLDVLSDRAIPMSTAIELSILNDVATGMAYLHSSSPQIIHRNLKSSNVLLSESMQAKVCDFGLTITAHTRVSEAARVLGSEQGSLLWSAPEVISHGAFSAKSDVYAYGIVLWEVVTREVPYKDMNPALVPACVVEKSCRPTVGPEFETVQPLRGLMEQCWAQLPDARPEFSGILAGLYKASEFLRETYLGACTEPHNLFVVTEWMEMGSLRQHLSRSSRQMDRQQGIAILASTCSALTGSASEQLGKNMDVKVSDFGMAAVKSASKISTLCGSVAWMAPEVLSTATYSEASDVYSFGIVMSEIMAGEIPFKGLNKVAVAREILQGKRPDIPKVRGAYSSHFVELMSQCWSQQPSHRPTFKTIGTALETM